MGEPEEDEAERCEDCRIEVGREGAKDYARDEEDGVVFCLTCSVQQIAAERDEALRQVADLERRLAATAKREIDLRQVVLFIAEALERKLAADDSMETVVLVSDKEGP